MSAVPGDGRLQPWETVQSAADGVYRTERAAILATLTRQVRDFQLAEDALQDAFVDAVSSWPRDGVPANPAAWISTTARRRAIDLMRRAQAQHHRAPRACL